MRIIIGAMVLSVAFGISRSGAQDTGAPGRRQAIPAAAAPVATTTAAAEQPATTSPEVAAIQASSDAFVTAFNQQNAKAVAALWTESGEYLNDNGQSMTGRAEIEQGYQSFFTENPGATIRIMIDSIRLVSSGTAIEDGQALVTSSEDDAGQLMKYTVVHAKVGQQWLMASVRDSQVETPPAESIAADLNWLVGKWIAEEHGVKTESLCAWAVDGHFLERKYTTTQIDGSTTSGVQMIGWNAIGNHVQSWDFSPEGGHAVGIWLPAPDGWRAQIQGVTGSGQLTTSVNLLRRLDDNAYVWQSIQRTAAGMSIPDTDEVILKRVPSSR